MNEDLLKLEYDRVLESVRAFAGSARGADLVSSLEPAADETLSLLLRNETLEAAGLKLAGSSFPGCAVDFLEDCLEQLEGGAIALDPSVLRGTGEALAALSEFRSGLNGTGLPWKDGVLAERFHLLPDLGSISRHLLRITTPEGTVSPSASELLSRLARSASRLRETLTREAARLSDRLIASGDSRDAPPSMRNGRFVIPLIAARRKAVAGMIHDRSDSGGTVFVEPEQLLEPGNRLQEMVFEIQQEERRILREATLMLRENAPGLRNGATAGLALDSIFARAAFHLERSTSFPSNGDVNLHSVRHPLIPDSESVPNDMSLPGDWRVLIISGPNAGGKTVLVKTLGLAACCSQSGLGITAAPGSTLPFFSKILVSIGDRQSLQERLSTYSARLHEELRMIRTADSLTLAIIDEPAGGTDPLSGSALAAVLLEELASRGARVVATTHLGQLKSLASSHPGFYNASMNFDDIELSPDYRFRFGLPGSSFTFEIAGRIGFPADLLARAAGLSQDSFRLDRLIGQLESDILALEQERAAAREAAVKAGEMKVEFEELLRIQADDADRQRRETRKCTDDLLKDLNSRADSLLTRVRGSDPDDRKVARRAIRELACSLPDPPPQDEARVEKDGIEPGDSVITAGWKGAGMVEDIRGETAIVRFGAIRVEKHLSDLSISPESASSTRESPAFYSVQAPSPEIDLRGRSSEEAIAEIDLRIDSCRASGLSRLRIIHGKGKGILMKAVFDFLKRDRRVASHAMAEPREGGTGVTIAILRELR